MSAHLQAVFAEAQAKGFNQQLLIAGFEAAGYEHVIALGARHGHHSFGLFGGHEEREARTHVQRVVGLRSSWPA